MSKKHVFISYVHEDQVQVRGIVYEIEKRGETVWWDAKIKKGDTLDFAVGKALDEAYAAVLCVSTRSTARAVSGIYDEYAKVIAAVQKLRPGEVFVFVVRLDDCEVPYILIDSQRTLRNLVWTDYLPTDTEDRRSKEIDALVAAIKETPFHP